MRSLEEQCVHKRYIGHNVVTWCGSTGGQAENSSKTPVSGGGQGLCVSVKMWNNGGGSPLDTTPAVTVSMNTSNSMKYSGPVSTYCLLSPIRTCIAKFMRDSSNMHSFVESNLLRCIMRVEDSCMRYRSYFQSTTRTVGSSTDPQVSKLCSGQICTILNWFTCWGYGEPICEVIWWLER